MKRMMILGLLMMPLLIIGCMNDNSTNVVSVPPAAPTGLVSITGDNSVYLAWYGVDQSDIISYRIYRSETSPDADFVRIGQVQNSILEFTDYNVTNGQTYYYRVASINESGDRSDFSNYAIDTPRPEGHNVTIYDYHDAIHYDFTGFDLYAGERVPYDSLVSYDFAW